MNKDRTHGYEWANDVDWANVPGCILEIGSERGGGSTAYLAGVARRLHRVFYSVDFEEDAYNRANAIKGCTAYHMRGEEFLKLGVSDGFVAPVAFAYLDNYDWLYRALPKPSAARQTAVYARYGLELNNLRSAEAHVEQCAVVEQFMRLGAIIAFDDTWMSAEHDVWLGKGMTAVPMLQFHGWQLISEPLVATEVTNGYAVLQRMVK